MELPLHEVRYGLEWLQVFAHCALHKPERV